MTVKLIPLDKLDRNITRCWGTSSYGPQCGEKSRYAISGPFGVTRMACRQHLAQVVDVIADSPLNAAANGFVKVAPIRKAMT
jgi:hypothetical protein